MEDFPELQRSGFPKTQLARARGHKQRRSSKKRKVLVMADSHGKELGPLLNERLGRSWEATVIARPGAQFNYVTSEADKLAKDFDFGDMLVILGGTNDVDDSSNQPCNLNTEVVKSLAKKTNVAVASIPYRYDKPLMNRNVHRLNQWLHRELDSVENVNFLDLNSLSLSDYTNHGLHLNKRKGKGKLADIIVNMINQTKCNTLNRMGNESVTGVKSLTSGNSVSDTRKDGTSNKSSSLTFTSKVEIILYNKECVENECIIKDSTHEVPEEPSGSQLGNGNAPIRNRNSELGNESFL